LNHEILINKFQVSENESEIINRDNQNDPKWSLENGYKNEKDENVYPIRAAKVNSLSFDIYSNFLLGDFIHICKGSGNGFLYYMHMPNEYPNPVVKSKVLKSRQKTEVKISAKVTKFTEDLRKFPPNIRNCYFDNERKLKFYKIYTKVNCEFECITNFTFKSCGCVHFGMPRQKDTKVCGYYDFQCYYWNATQYFKYEKNEESLMPCGCLPSCTEIEYSIDSEKEESYHHRLDPGSTDDEW
jgi:amiloride-sensitive sodium channel